MSACDFADSALVELYFYGELDADGRGRVDAHVRECAACRQRLADLRMIRDALAAMPRVDAPPAGDWSGFMRRLDQVCARPAAPAGVPRLRLAPALAVAATLALVASGLFLASRAQQPAPPAGTPSATVRPVRAAASPVAAPARTVLAQSEEHLERSKLVVLGLATLDARKTRPADWAYERELAGSLLPDTRLFRNAAEQRGLRDVAGAMGDLETVLLETSLSDDRDPDALARVQRLIRRRDLLAKMQMMHESGN